MELAVDIAIVRECHYRTNESRGGDRGTIHPELCPLSAFVHLASIYATDPPLRLLRRGYVYILQNS